MVLFILTAVLQKLFHFCFIMAKPFIIFPPCVFPSDKNIDTKN